MLGLADVPAELQPNPNVSPGDGVAVVTDGVQRSLDFFKWGLVPSWAKDISIGNKLINARAETLIEKSSFRNAFARRRCLIPASGFYEWRAEGGRKQPYLFQLADKKAFTFAGLWEHWQDN
ncbi:MAG: SOS response-associated peptidase, partial [Anaerolineaceae bacterium]